MVGASKGIEQAAGSQALSQTGKSTTGPDKSTTGPNKSTTGPDKSTTGSDKSTTLATEVQPGAVAVTQKATRAAASLFAEGHPKSYLSRADIRALHDASQNESETREWRGEEARLRQSSAAQTYRKTKLVYIEKWYGAAFAADNNRFGAFGNRITTQIGTASVPAGAGASAAAPKDLAMEVIKNRGATLTTEEKDAIDLLRAFCLNAQRSSHNLDEVAAALELLLAVQSKQGSESHKEFNEWVADTMSQIEHRLKVLEQFENIEGVNKVKIADLRKVMREVTSASIPDEH